MKATPIQRVRIALSLGLLSMIVGLVFVQRSVAHVWSGGAFEDHAYDWIQAIGLFLLVASSLSVAIGTIYGARKLISTKAAAVGAVCLGIAATFLWTASLEGGINTHDWTLALVVPEFVWTAAGVLLLLVSAIRFILVRVHG